jgi:hypothetical protein
MCNPSLPLIGSRECLHFSKTPSKKFSAFYKIGKNEYAGVICSCLNHITEFTICPNYTIRSYLFKQLPVSSIYRFDAKFKDGRTLCNHCKNYLDKLRNNCNGTCTVDIFYI